LSDLATIRDAIVATLDGVSGSGWVYSYQRFIENASAFAALYKDPADGRVRGWFVQRAATKVESPAVGRDVVTHTWRIQGFTALDDATQSRITFDDLIEDIRTAFRADEELGGAAETVVDGRAGIQVDDVGEVWFLKTLCHGAKLTLFTRHFE
jgi:hypothetical protein